MEIDQLLQLLDDPAKIARFEVQAAFCELSDDQLPHDDDLPVLTRLYAVEQLATLGPAAAVAVPRLLEIAPSKAHSDLGQLLRLER